MNRIRQKLDSLGPRRTFFLGLALALAVVACLCWWLIDRDHVTTDNAYVNADSAHVTSVVSASVIKVLVVNTQAVKKGDILVRLDDTDMRLALARAEAELQRSRRQFGQTVATGLALGAQITASHADISRAQAAVEIAQSALFKAKTDLERRTPLARNGAVSAEELTDAHDAYAVAQGNLEQARAGLAKATASHDAAMSSRAANDALIAGSTVDTHPDVLAAKARLDQAQMDLARTVIRAPISGVVTNRQVQVGQRVATGTTIMTIVPVAAAYVDANFKEGQLRHVRPGQPVELTSDLYGSGVVYHGRVAGFAGGTGSAFALIPAQNATGNWIKVVQRLPVRVTLDPRELARHPLRVGLSMEVSINVSDGE